MNVDYRFPFLRPTLPEPAAWLPYLEESYRERRFANGGPAATLLERRIEEAHGARREAIAVASGTAGLVAALLALEARGRVVVPSFTFAATAHAVRLAGCEPVFCEVAHDTWELDRGALEAVLEDGAAGVVHVRPFGLCRDLGPIERVCAAAGVPLVVDSAAALGGVDERGASVGGAGVAEVFSLHATKALGIGEGGVVLADPVVAGRIRRAINFGFDGDGDVVAAGLNGKLSEFAAAVGLAALADAPAAIAARRSAAGAWAAALHGTAARLPVRAGNPVWQTFPLLLPAGCDADGFVAALARRGLQARRYYRPALHRTPAFARDVRLPVTDALAARMVCLPIYADQEGSETREMMQIVRDELSVLELRAAA